MPVMDVSWRRWWMRWRSPLSWSLGLHVLLFWPQALPDATGNAVAARLQARLHIPLVSPPVTQPPVVTEVTPTRVIQPARPQAMPIQPQANVMAQPVLMQASTGLDAGGVRAYRLALARVPAFAALQPGTLPQGELELGIEVDTAAVGLIRSSGDTSLDERVLGAVRAAVHEAPVPAILRGAGAVVPLRIRTGE